MREESEETDEERGLDENLKRHEIGRERKREGVEKETMTETEKERDLVRVGYESKRENKKRISMQKDENGIFREMK